MPRLIRAVVAVFAASCLMVGCQPSAPMPTPSPSGTGTSPSAMPTPTFLCTPEAGGDESPCTQAQYDEMKAKDALYAEAEEVYRAYWAEVVRIMREGGATEPTDVLLRTTYGFQLDDVMANLRELKDDGAKPRGDDPKVVWIRRLPGQSKDGSIVAVSSCVDATGWAFYSGDRLVSKGRSSVDDLYFGRFDDGLKIIGADGRDTESCAS